jgi:KAP family P-loop domain
VVFIDDLDRCSEEKIMEVLQAITLILGDSRFFVFLGMDTEMIHRAIRVHYTKDQIDPKLPPKFAEKYLRKIIQVSFYLPDASKRSRLAYIKSLFSVTPQKSTGQTEAEDLAGTEGAPKPLGDGERPTPPTTDDTLPISFAYLRQPLSREVQDTDVELSTFQDHLRFLEDNPREVKRLINLHRLVKIFLAEKQQLLRRDEEQRSLVRWLIFCARWPDLVNVCLAVAEEEPDSSNILESLMRKLIPEQAQAQVALWDETNTPPSTLSLEALGEFANFGDYEPLSAKDINNFKLGVQISTLVPESVVAPSPNEELSRSVSPPTQDAATP